MKEHLPKRLLTKFYRCRKFAKRLFFSMFHIRFYKQIKFAIKDSLTRLIIVCLTGCWHAGLGMFLGLLVFGSALAVIWLGLPFFPLRLMVGIIFAFLFFGFILVGWENYRDTSKAKQSAKYDASLRRCVRRHRMEMEEKDRQDNWWRGNGNDQKP